MLILDDGIQDACALVIDSNPTSRSIMAAQLRDLGVGSVRQTGRVKDARVILEHKAYDIVLCDYHFDSCEMSGQDLLDELRRENLLPYATVFIMVTGEASYSKVAEAAEAALDAYLVKPYTSTSLAERLTSARRRKKVLREIFDAIESKAFDRAADLCLQRFESKGLYWLYAARIGAELLLRQNRLNDARKLYDAIIEAKTVPWARLGVARTEMASGDMLAARRTLETLIGDLPDHADSYDLMGRVQLEQGELGAALQTYQTAARLTPGCLLRQQRAGTLAFYAGLRVEALKLLDSATINGLRSKLYDIFSLVLVALIRFDDHDGRNLRQAQDTLAHEVDRDPKSTRLRRFALVVDALCLLHARRLADAVERARQFAQALDEEDFDLEAASLLLSLWVRLARQDLTLEEMQGLMQRVGLRYCTSKASTEVLLAMCEDHESARSVMRESHAHIFSIAETAMRHAMRGNAEQGIELLISQGGQTRNAKLIDMALAVLKRHEEKIGNPEALLARIEDLQQRHVLPLGNTYAKRAGRAVGGLALRT